MRPRPVGTLLALVLGLALGACRISNEDHCVHKSIDADAWCADNVEGRPFCSPCASSSHGCVAERPDDADCPAYLPDDEADPASTGTTAATTG